MAFLSGMKSFPRKSRRNIGLEDTNFMDETISTEMCMIVIHGQCPGQQAGADGESSLSSPFRSRQATSCDFVEDCVQRHIGCMRVVDHDAPAERLSPFGKSILLLTDDVLEEIHDVGLREGLVAIGEAVLSERSELRRDVIWTLEHVATRHARVEILNKERPAVLNGSIAGGEDRKVVITIVPEDIALGL